MLSTVFSALLSTLLSIHALLYHPIFPSTPQVYSKEYDQMELTLSVPTQMLRPAPTISAKSAIVIDQHSGEILFSKDPDKRLFPASTTKIMTALLAIESIPLDSVASISSGLVREGSAMDLVPGVQIRVRDLVAGVLISSANDAADQLSILFPGGREAFVQRMNERAKELGLVNTVYTNPTGYSDPGHVTTVRDLALLTRVAMQQPEFAVLVSQKDGIVKSIDGRMVYQLKSTNELLGKVDGVEGVKTGWTEEAGECFVAQATRSGQTYIVVVLGSTDRFGETRSLFDWVFAGYRSETRTLDQW